MHVMNGTTPPRQRCVHQAHDGTPGREGMPSSRSSWPLHGFEESVATHRARAARDLGLPDLSGLRL
jgi:hypothetical protein